MKAEIETTSNPGTGTIFEAPVFSGKKLAQMAALGIALGAVASYCGGITPEYHDIGQGILWSLPLGLFNYYLACRAVGFLGSKQGTMLFGSTIAFRWALALVALFLAVTFKGVWFLVGVALGVEIQMLRQLVDAVAVIVGLRRLK